MLTLVESLSARALRQSAKTADAAVRPASDATPRTLAPGEVLFREGDPRSHVFRVETGALCLYRSLPDGGQDVIEFAFPGDLVGLGYLDSHVATAKATTETSLSCLPRSAVDPAVDDASRARLTAAIQREVAYLEQAHQQRRPEAVRRVAALFVTLSRYNGYEGRDPALITDSLKCGTVAAYLGMSVDQLAAQLAELERRGLVEPCEGGLRLKQVDALERLADARD